MLKLLPSTRHTKLTPFVSFFFSTQEKFRSYPKNRDHVVRGYTKDGNVRFSFLDCSTAVNTSLANFHIKDSELYCPLSNTFTFSLLLSSLLKGEERVKVILTYLLAGNIKTFYAESMANGEIRGFAKDQPKNPETTHQSLLSVARVNYYKSLTVDYASGKTEQIKDVMHKYFETSEQISTYGNLHYDLNDNQPKALGYLLQSLPGCPEQHISNLYQNVFEKKIWPSILASRTLDAENIKESFKEVKIDVEINRYPVDFYCRCKKEDFMVLLKNFDAKVLVDMNEKNENELQCLYCNKSYFLEKKDFEDIIKEKTESQKIESH